MTPLNVRPCPRVWYMGCALAFQAREPGSNPGTRFTFFTLGRYHVVDSLIADWLVDLPVLSVLLRHTACKPCASCSREMPRLVKGHSLETHLDPVKQSRQEVVGAEPHALIELRRG